LYGIGLPLAIAAAGFGAGIEGAALTFGLGCGVFGFAVSGTAQAVATARLDARSLIPFQAAAGIAFLVLVSVVALTTTSAVAVAWAFGVAELIGGALFFIPLKRAVGKFTREPIPHSWWRPLADSWPIALVASVGTIYARLGIWALALWWGATSVAQYGIAQRVVEIGLLASSAVAGSAYALTAQVDSESGEEAVRGLLERLVRRISGTVLLLAAAIAIGATWLPVALGGGYELTISTTRVLAWSLPVIFANGILTAHLYGLGKFRTVLKIVLINLPLNAALLAVLLPRGGPSAAALAVVCTECANTMWQSRAARLGARAWSWWIAAACLIAGIANYALGSDGI
jgi:O-antigen/teichoic acid export membrane protein